MTYRIFTKTLYTGTGILHDQVVVCDNGLIEQVSDGDGNACDLHTENLAAGFFDVHINGGESKYFTKDPSTEGVRDIAESCAALGTAYTLPTVITSSMENIFQAVEAMRDYMQRNTRSGVIGMHLEGPFISPRKRGAHLLKYIQQPSDEVLREVIRKGEGVIRVITIAPEVLTQRQIDMLLESGITVSAGHSDATYAQATAVFEKGVRLVTHLYNAMSALTHREPGLVGACFNNSDVYAPIILDGFHCDFAAARIAYKIKKEKLFLISDALFVGAKVDHFVWEEYDVRLRDGRYMNTEGNLAGATISMGDAVVNAVKELGISLQEAVEMATIRPAMAVNAASAIGRVAPGYPAVFTSFDDRLQQFSVVRP